MNRVVITGLGIVAPNGIGLEEYENSLRKGISGIRFIPKMEEQKFSCQVAGVPQNTDKLASEYFSADSLMAMNSSMVYAGIASKDCWKDASLPDPDRANDFVDWDTGAIIGTGISGMDTIGGKIVPNVDNGKVRRLGSTMVEQCMGSSVSALVGGIFGLGNQVTTNSSACTTGTEAIVEGYFAIRSGRGKRFLAGGAEGSSPYAWAGFDSMRVLSKKYNDNPEKASRPMSASAAGFVPGSGAGVLMLESLESAQERGARIYAEILSANINCGGQRQGGSITAPNPNGVKKCIREAITSAKLSPADIDVINGHLTATMADPIEVNNWKNALELSYEEFPMINSTKSLIGHGLGAAGGLECVASILQLDRNFIHGSINCEDLHEELKLFEKSIPHKTIENSNAKIMAKASFGFGDVNACVIFKKWEG